MNAQEIIELLNNNPHNEVVLSDFEGDMFLTIRKHTHRLFDGEFAFEMNAKTISLLKTKAAIIKKINELKSKWNLTELEII